VDGEEEDDHEDSEEEIKVNENRKPKKRDVGFYELKVDSLYNYLLALAWTFIKESKYLSREEHSLWKESPKSFKWTSYAKK
jgi:hypothetical protein